MTEQDPHAERRTIREAAHEWRARMDDELADAETCAELNAWLAEDPRHAEEYERVSALWSSLEEVGAEDFDRQVLNSLEIFNATLTNNAVPKGWRQQPWFARTIAAAVTAGVAAAIAVAVLPVPAIVDTEPATTVQTFTSARGEIEEIMLADGSGLTLGAMSSVEVTIGSGIRTVSLTSGEAFFDIASDRDRPFTVTADDLSVEVTGTAFDVRLGETRTDVAVTEGDVSVSYPIIVGGIPRTSIRTRRQVTAGRSITATRERGLRPPEDIRGDAAVWRTGRLTYAGTPLADVVADANRYSETPIRIDTEVRMIRVSGSFDANQIEETLDILADILPITIDRSDPAAIWIVAADG
ncbi:MAG: FecR domain-containing protein [Pseudomonadota bacterium]